MAYVPKRPGTIKKYRAIQDRFKELSDQKDDDTKTETVVLRLMQEYNIECEATMWRIISTNLKKE